MNGALCPILAAALFVPASMAEQKKSNDSSAYRLQWGDLGRIVTNRRVSLTLPSGIRLQGDVTSVEPDSLVLFVTKTSDKRAYPKGRGLVPRPEVTTLRVSKTTGYTWRVAGTAIGGGLGALLGVGLAQYASSRGGHAVAAGVAGVVIPTALGYLGGWSADRKTFLVSVEPEPR